MQRVTYVSTAGTTTDDGLSSTVSEHTEALADIKADAFRDGGSIEPQPSELGRFVNALFKHASPGSYVSVRALPERGSSAGAAIEGVCLNGASVAKAIGHVLIRMARQAAASPVPMMLAPPVATFSGVGKADAASLVDGLALSVDLDAAAADARERLETLLGPATVVVASGGTVTDLETGEVRDKLHLHWRLARPARGADEHARLHRAREAAARLVEGDTSCAPPVHPFRWPGSVHRKGPPRLVRIVDLAPAVEIDLDKACAALGIGDGSQRRPSGVNGTLDPRHTPASGGTGLTGLPAAFLGKRHRPLSGEDALACAHAMANVDLLWGEWNTIGMAFHRGCDDREAGRKAFHIFSAKSDKYDSAETDARWQHYHRSPPNQVGAQTLRHWATRARPGFVLPSVLKERKKLVKDKYSIVTNDIRNATTILRTDPELAGRIAYDEMKELPVCRDLPWAPGDHWQDWKDVYDDFLHEWFHGANSRDMRTKISRETAAQAVNIVAAENRFNPVQDYLDDLRWDGTPRLRDWTTRYLGVAASPISKEFGYRWMISAVARAHNPGVKADHVLILEGPQGARKSSALRALMPNPRWFTDQLSDIHKKDASEDLRGVWLVELSEMSAIRKSENESIKSFISRQTERFRAAYGKRTQEFPRKCIFAGSTNSTVYHTDTTGARRYWPVKVGVIDIATIHRDRDQLWAEAVELYRQGEAWHLTPQMEADASAEQAERRAQHPWEEAIREYVADKEWVAVPGIMHRLGIPLSLQHTGNTRQIAEIMNTIGWERKQVRADGGKREWRYQPSKRASSPLSPVAPQPASDPVTEKAGSLNAFTTVTTVTTRCSREGEEREKGYIYGNAGATGATGDRLPREAARRATASVPRCPSPAVTAGTGDSPPIHPAGLSRRPLDSADPSPAETITDDEWMRRESLMEAPEDW